MNSRRLVGAGPSAGPISQSCSRLLATGFVLLLPLAALSGAEQARADDLPSNCAVSETTVTCTYTAGSEGTFKVPRGVHHIDVVAIGASGGSSPVAQGGAGTEVTALGLIVRPGSRLYAEVDIGGGQGVRGPQEAGGGESDLRSCSITDPDCPAVGTQDDPRLIVAGGGGGAGGSYGDEWGGNGGSAGVGTTQCNPGNAGVDGTGGRLNRAEGPVAEATGGGGGGAGGCSSGGAGGAPGETGAPGADGTASSGGAGGPGQFGGGGGGAGYFGGGGGGQGDISGGGGGGGSSFGPAGAAFARTNYSPQVQVSYLAP